MNTYKYKWLTIIVTAIQQNQVSEIPNDNNEIEAQEDNEVEPVIVDTIETRITLDTVETLKPHDVSQDRSETVVKVKKPRVKQ